MIRFRILRVLSVIFIMTGVAFCIWSFVGLKKYYTVNSENRLAPAGTFFDAPENFSFAVIADSGMREGPLGEIIDRIKSEDAKFLFHLGDQARRLKGNHFEYMLDFMNSRLGSLPFYAVPGNHDKIDKEQNTSRYYNRIFGQAYYWFSYGDTLFIALDTAGADFNKEQREWLRKVLTKLRPTFKNCIMFMHVPPKDPRPGESYAMERDTEEFYDVIKAFNITAIFAGHIHEYLESSFKGIPLFIVPPSGQKMRGATTQYGYLLCTVGQGLKVEKRDVTSNTSRDYFAAIFSTDFDGMTAFVYGFIAMFTGFVLAFACGRMRKS